jgi:hypothetical protein
MRTLTHTLLASALVFGSASVFAQGEPANPVVDPGMTTEAKPSFDQLDTNRDGTIAKTEIPADHELNTLFASLDSDSSQSLSRIVFDDYANEAEEEAE